MGKHGNEKGLTIFLELERVRVVQGAHLEGVDIFEDVKLLQSVFEPEVGLLDGGVKGVSLTLTGG